jgi:AN1-type zinc finger and ubiquitin domain-containing protein 1
VNQRGRRGSRQHNLPAIVSTSVPLSVSKKTNHNTGNNGHLLDMKPRQNSDCGQGRGIASGSGSEKTRNSREDLSGKHGVSVTSTPKIAIVEENDSAVAKEEPDFSSLQDPIIVPSKEATTFTVSQICRERVRTPIGNSQNRYRVSELILDDDSRPKTSPDELTQQQKGAQELCDILSETEWQRLEQQQKLHYSNSQLEILGDLPVQQRKNESYPKDFLQQDKRTTTDLTFPRQSSLIDVTTQSPRYGRRSVMLLSAKNHVKRGRVEHDAAAVHQTELNLDAHSVRQSRRQSSSSVHSSLMHPAHKVMGELGQHPLSLSQELAPQSLPLVPTKKKSTVRSRCAECRKRLNITNVYTCRCEKLFCAAHRYSELHNCTFDYKTDGRKILEQTNPLVTAPKLPKI